MKHIIRIVIIAFLALGISVGLWFFLNKYLLKSKASNSVAHFAFAEKSIQVKGGDFIHADLVVTAQSGISALDILFTTGGTNLAFSYLHTAGNIPKGFVENGMILDEANVVSSDKTLKRLVFASVYPAAKLPKSVIIPIYFTVVNNGDLTAKTTLTVNLSSSMVVGPDTVFSLEGESTPLTFTVELTDPRAVPPTNLTCTSICGQNIILKWTDSPNEDIYLVYKDGVLLTPSGLGKNTTVYPYNWCGDFANHTYVVASSNTNGWVSQTEPAISCACYVCPTPAPPTPTPIKPTNSSDLIFRLNFPDIDMNISQVPNVRVTVLDNEGKKICKDDTDCAQIVTFNRIYNTNGPTTYFSSPQLQFNLKEQRAYSIVVKQNRTIQRVYKNVYLRWQMVLNCLVPNGAINSGCGELISSSLDRRPMLSGDIDGFDTTLAGYNTIDSDDRSRVDAIAQSSAQNKSAEGDVNLDGKTDINDISIIQKNLNKKGD